MLRYCRLCDSPLFFFLLVYFYSRAVMDSRLYALRFVSGRLFDVNQNGLDLHKLIQPTGQI